ncbi:MAG: Chromosome partition protein Smc [Candidatus Heimdallarchaeota archaeon LC_3]|nr:MAG: Chromosome partition protein Smc [Candidatus Heimdallarchaeota archaeon LC_3]
MRIKTLKIQNYRSYSEEQTIDFTKGINFIVGPNGSGKTNIIRAIQLISQCITEKYLPLDNLDPEIKIKMETELSEVEIELIGAVIAKTLIKAIKEILQEGNFTKFRDLVFKPIVESFEQVRITDFAQTLKKELNIQNADYFKGDEKLIDKHNNLLNHINFDNIDTIKSILINEVNVDSNQFGFFLNNKMIENVFSILTDEKTLKKIGLLFKNLKFLLYGNLRDVHVKFKTVNLLGEWEIGQTSILYNKQRKTRSYGILEMLHNFAKQNIEYDDLVVKNAIKHLTNKSESWIVSMENTDIYQGEGELKTISKKIIQLLEKNSISKIDLNVDEQSNSYKISLESIIQLIFKKTTFLIPEHRGLIQNSETGLDYITTHQMAERLFWWKNSQIPQLREKYYNLQKSFENIFNLKFDIKAEKKIVILTSKQPIISLSSIDIPGNTNSLISQWESESRKVLTWKKDEKEREELKISLQFLYDEKYPLEISDAPSGAYETLLILTTFFEFGSKTIIIDEPGRALHPQLQRKLVTEINKIEENDRPNFIVVTHSPYFIRNIENTLVKCLGNGKISKINIDMFGNEDKNGVKRIIRRIDIFSPLLFANRTIFVEGPEDKLFIEELENKFGIFNLEQNNWDVVAIGGKDFYPIIGKVSKKLNLQNVVIFDLDAAFPKEKRGKSDEKLITVKMSTVYQMFNKIKNADAKTKDFFNALSKFKDYDESSIINDGKLEDLRNLLQSKGIFVWKEGRLEEVFDDINKTRKINKKVDLIEVYDCVDKMGEIENFSSLIKLKEFIDSQLKD